MQGRSHILIWLPRILSILAIMFISIFAFDAFEGEQSIWLKLVGFLIHLIPSLILLAILLVAWRWQLIGGLIFLLLGLGFTPVIYNHNYAMNQSISTSLSVVLVITAPFIVIGILFIISHIIYRR